MAYALGYDPADFASDDEDSQPSTTRNINISQPNGVFRNMRRDPERDHSFLPSPLEMDRMNTAELERLEWMEPLGYRALSEITRISPGELRRHFWATRLKTTSPEYQDIEYYFRNSGGGQIRRVVNLKRFNENNCDYKDPNVMLLWHGTNAIGEILTNGFRLPMHNGMFGRGVYFADRASKSMGYLRGGNALFLCAVNLGRVYQSPSAMNSLTAPPPGYDSVQGVGINIPDPRDVRYHRGAKIPCGRSTSSRAMYGGLQHNEFIVYDLSKIAILFLVEI